MVEASHPFEASFFVTMALLGLARALSLRLTIVMALAMVLRGSKPNERPALLGAFNDCLHCVPRPLSRCRHRRDRQQHRRR